MPKLSSVPTTRTRTTTTNAVEERTSSMSILDRMLFKHDRGSFQNKIDNDDDDDMKERESTMEDMYCDDDDDNDDERIDDHDKEPQQQEQQQELIESNDQPPVSIPATNRAANHHYPQQQQQQHWIEPSQDIKMAAQLNEDDHPNAQPPPVTDFQPTFHDDDDSVSQITSSIASHSYYNSLSAGSWGGPSRKSKPRPQQPEPSVGEPSLADTLDEIANMLQRPAQPTVTATGGAAVLSLPILNNGRTQRRAQQQQQQQQHSVVQLEKIYESQHVTADDGANHNPQHFYQKSPSIWEQYQKPSSSTSTTPSSWAMHLNPLVLLSHVMLQIKNFLWPSEYYIRKKTDGDDDHHRNNNNNINEDYFDALMGSGAGRKRRRRKGGGGRLRWVGVAFRFFLLFCLMTILLLVLRLGMISKAQFQDLTSRFKAGHVLRNMMVGDGSLQDMDGANGSGGSGGGGGAAAAVALAALGKKRGSGVGRRWSRHGGMAHHTNDDQTKMQRNNNNMAGDMGQQQQQQQQLIVADPERAGAGDGGGDPLPAMKVVGGYSHQEHIGLELPSIFENMADVNDMPVLHGVDIPFFWHVPRSMGGTVNDILGGCLGLTIASDAGGQGPAAKANKLLVTRYPGHFSYVNVDTSTAEGIGRARTLGLASSGLAGVVVSTLLHNAASLFTEDNQGRMFTIVRHPIERAVSLFHFVQDTHWRQRETFRKDLAELSIDEYFKSGLSENNWMTRVLVNELTKGELTREDVNVAKEVLRRKCLVGLLKEKGETFARFERYFGWQLKTEEDKDCHEKKLQWAWPLKHRHDEVEEGSAMWDVIVAHNIYDMELYDYAMVLFEEQASLFK